MEKLLMEGYPSVYAVEDQYRICVLTAPGKECTMWAEVGGKTYYDHSGGVLRSGRFLHMVSVPMALLDKEKKYTVSMRELLNRKPYFTECGEAETWEYAFRPLPAGKNPLHIMHVADTHCLVKEPLGSGSYFGDSLDLLIMNGDIPNSSGDVEFFRGIYQISGGITKGEVPCIFSRGNHDLRGRFAEQMADYSPTRQGYSYYTFRLGDVWGIVLDTGEDKSDDHAEYGHTVCCEAFRREETDYLQEVISQKTWEGARVRLVICHNPFTHRLQPPFDIEQDLWRDWAQKLKTVHPTLMLSGHLHACFLSQPGSAYDSFGVQPCTLICASDKGNGKHIAGAVTLYEDRVEVKYVNQEGAVIGSDADALA